MLLQFFIKTVEAVVLVIAISMALSGGVEPKKTALALLWSLKLTFRLKIVTSHKTTNKSAQIPAS